MDKLSGDEIQCILLFVDIPTIMNVALVNHSFHHQITFHSENLWTTLLKKLEQESKGLTSFVPRRKRGNKDFFKNRKFEQLTESQINEPNTTRGNILFKIFKKQYLFFAVKKVKLSLYGLSDHQLMSIKNEYVLKNIKSELATRLVKYEITGQQLNMNIFRRAFGDNYLQCIFYFDLYGHKIFFQEVYADYYQKGFLYKHWKTHQHLITPVLVERIWIFLKRPYYLTAEHLHCIFTQIPLEKSENKDGIKEYMTAEEIEIVHKNGVEKFMEKLDLKVPSISEEFVHMLKNQQYDYNRGDFVY